MKYEKFSYLYPPRPIQTTHHSQLDKYDDGTFIAQPKYNGTCCNVFISEDEFIVMNRHKGMISSKSYTDIDFKGLHRGKGWMVVCGEFLNKNKLGEDGKPFNLKFVIWDIIVYEGQYLIGKTLLERLNLLEELYPCTKMVVSEKFESFKHLCFTRQKNIYKSPFYVGSFEKIYQSIVKTDLYEGLVLKRKNAKLSYGLNERNNNEWQIKCRKPTKNYDF